MATTTLCYARLFCRNPEFLAVLYQLPDWPALVSQTRTPERKGGRLILSPFCLFIIDNP